MDGIADPPDYPTVAAPPATFSACRDDFVGVKTRRWPLRRTPLSINRAPTLYFAKNGANFLISAAFSG